MSWSITLLLPKSQEQELGHGTHAWRFAAVLYNDLRPGLFSLPQLVDIYIYIKKEFFHHLYTITNEFEIKGILVGIK